jgi:hypothetical protein
MNAMPWHDGELKCHWRCECGHVNDCPTKRNDHLADDEEAVLMKARRNNFSYFCGKCHKSFSPYSIEGAGTIRPQREGEIFNTPKPWPWSKK